MIRGFLKTSLIIVVATYATAAFAEEFEASFIKTRFFSDGEYCVYKHHDSGRIFVGKVPDAGCPQYQKIPPALFGKVPTPVFSLFNEVEFLPIDTALSDQFFETRSHIVDYQVGTVDTAEYEALVSQLNRCAAFQIDIMGKPFVMTHDTNTGFNISGKATIRGDTSLRLYSFSCNRPDTRGPQCVVTCEHDCGDDREAYVIESIFDTPYSVMYRMAVPSQNYAQ